jgi:hypothetical protein
MSGLWNTLPSGSDDGCRRVPCSPLAVARGMLLQLQVVTEAQLPVLGVVALHAQAANLMCCSCRPEAGCVPPSTSCCQDPCCLRRSARARPGLAVTHARKNTTGTVVGQAGQGWRVAWCTDASLLQGAGSTGGRLDAAQAIGAGSGRVPKDTATQHLKVCFGYARTPHVSSSWAGRMDSARPAHC